MSTVDYDNGLYWATNSAGVKPLNVSPPPSSTSVDRVAVLERQMNAALAMIAQLNEQVENLKSQQIISVAGKKCTLDKLTDAVADKLNAKANLW